MNEFVIESFINFCDDMTIAQESMRLKEFHKIKKDTMKKIKDMEKRAGDPSTPLKERIRIYKSLLKTTDDAIQTVRNMQPDNWDKFFNVLGWLGYVSGFIVKGYNGSRQRQDSYDNKMATKTLNIVNDNLSKMDATNDPRIAETIAKNTNTLTNLKKGYRQVSIKHIIIWAIAWGVSFVGKKNTLSDKKNTKNQLLSTFSKKYIQYDAEIKRLERVR